MKSIIEKGLRFIYKEYYKDQYFGFEEIFPSILILDSLNEIGSKKSKIIRDYLTNNLLKDKSKNWSFNYWKKGSLKRNEEPYPDDLDDTCCALAAIIRNNQKTINGKALAKIVNQLIVSEMKSGGPYRTWILPKNKANKWKGVDLAVNSNIGYFLKLLEVDLENINKFIEDKIRKSDFISPFYKGELPVIYLISRFYQGDYKNLIKERVFKLVNENSSALSLALAISSLIRLGFINEVNQKWIDNLIKKQNTDGGFEREDFYYYKSKEGDFIGCRSLSTAFVLETISLFKKEKKKTKTNNLLKKINDQIVLKTKTRFNSNSKEIKLRIFKIIDKLNKNNIITLTPYFAWKSLKRQEQKRIKKELIINLGELNLLGWCAYTIYDEIIDENNKTELLPIANIICREMELGFYLLPIRKETGFFKLYKEIMQKIEEANYWEIKNLRFNKNQEKIKLIKIKEIEIVNKSMGHALTSVAIWCYLGYSTKSTEVNEIINYFKNFIMARQINDDAHDWIKDLKAGQVSMANWWLLEKFKDNLPKLLDVGKKTKTHKIDYWQNEIPKLYKLMIRHNQKAMKNLLNIKNISKNRNYLLELINKNIKIAEATLRTKKETLEFVKNYYL